MIRKSMNNHWNRSLIVFGILLVLTVMASLPAAGQGPAPTEETLRQLVSTHNSAAAVTELQFLGEWAQGAIVEVCNGEYVVGEGSIFVARLDGTQWTVYWEGTPEFRHILPQVPEGLLSAAKKEELDYEDLPTGQEEDILATGYKLPWTGGTTRYVSRAWASGSCNHGSNSVDIVMPLNSKVRAARGGTVDKIVQGYSYCGCRSSNPANYIRVRHSDGTYAYYVHIEKNSARVSLNQVVSQGQWLADSHMIGYTCGSTQCPSGTTCPSCKGGAHLHFHVTNSAGQRLHIHFDDVSGGHVYGCRYYTSGNSRSLGAESSSPFAPLSAGNE